MEDVMTIASEEALDIYQLVFAMSKTTVGSVPAWLVGTDRIAQPGSQELVANLFCVC